MLENWNLLVQKLIFYLGINKKLQLQICLLHFHILWRNGFWCVYLENILRLGWHLPQVMSNYLSVTLYYPFLMSNGITQIRLMVNSLCESQPQSTISLYLLLSPNLSNFKWELKNAHKTFNIHLQFLYSTSLWSITDYWCDGGITWVFTLLGVTYP